MSYDSTQKLTTASMTPPTATQALTYTTGALALDMSVAFTALVTLTANVSSWSMTNGVAGQWYAVTFIQDATGSRTLSSPAANIVHMGTTYLGGTKTAPTLTVTASKRDTMVFFYDGTNFIEMGRNFGN